MTALQQIDLQTIGGESTNLGAYAGKVLLLVNVASKCGLTPQYQGLETLYETYRDKGLVVCGFPANDFGAQEPGTNEEIIGFCTTSYGVDFPMFSKIAVTGEDKHPLYRALAEAMPDKQGDAEGFRDRLRRRGRTPTEDPEVLWNFEKFLIGRDGEVKARFAPTITPNDPALVDTIEKELTA